MRGQSDRAAIIAAVTATAMIAQQIAGKAARDTLFLASFSAAELPRVMLASAAIAGVGVLGLSRLLARYGPRRLVPIFFAISGGLFAAEALLQARAEKAVAVALYLHIAFFGAAVVSGFWSVVNERFDPHEAKHRIARIAAGATFGGLLGGVVAERVSVLFGTAALLPLLAAINGICALGVALIGRGARPASAPVDPRGGLRVLAASTFLRRVAAIVVLLALVGALLDFALKAEAEAAIESDRDLGRFFALYYTGLGIATFVVQSLASRPLLARIGIGGTLALLPAAVIALGLVGLFVLRLTVVVFLRGVASVIENSAFRSAYELLYTPVAPSQKRPTKLIIDVAGSRVGDALGSALVLVLLAFVTPAASVWGAIVAACVAGAVALILVLRLQRGYVEQLAASLRAGTLVLEVDAALDATTRRTLSETVQALDRESLLAEIEALRNAPAKAKEGTPAQRGEGARPDSEPSRPLPAGNPAEVLSAGESGAIREALRDPLDASLIPGVVALLAGAHRSRAARALRRAAPRHVGQLVDALLDPSERLEVRTRLPRIIAAAENSRAVSGLVLALEDQRFSVRYHAGLALAGLCQRQPALRPSKDVVFGLAEREVRIDRKVWESQRLVAEAPAPDDSLAPVLRERRDRSLEHVFNILSLVLDRETLRISLAALTQGHRDLRGTALEYLENVLPETLREGLWPYLTEGGPVKRSGRSREDLVDDLLRSMESLQLDREALLAEVALHSEPPPE